MANYRTIKELKPYKGNKITRLHKDGKWYYYTELFTASSLKELKKKIDDSSFHVIQLSIDIVVNDDYDMYDITNAVEAAGFDVFGSDITAGWTIDEYRKEIGI